MAMRTPSPGLLASLRLRETWPALLGLVCLADATNCIRLGHDDTWFPLGLAVVFTLLLRSRPGPHRGPGA